jgi:hypothetical protein
VYCDGKQGEHFLRQQLLILSVVVSLLLSAYSAYMVSQMDNPSRQPDGHKWSVPEYPTDEQAARQILSNEPVFKDLQMGQIGDRALMALCTQLVCGNRSDYVYSFKRDNVTVAGALWYRPVDPERADRRFKDDHFICRFNNEQWVVCNLKRTGMRGLAPIVARTPTVYNIGQWDKGPPLREKAMPPAP